MKRISPDGLVEFQEALEKVLANPSAVFEVADEVKALGFHAAAQRLHREAHAHAKEGGVCTGEAPQGENIVVWGQGPVKRWVRVNPTFFEKDMKVVAKKLRPRKKAVDKFFAPAK